MLHYVVTTRFQACRRAITSRILLLVRPSSVAFLPRAKARGTHALSSASSVAFPYVFSLSRLFVAFTHSRPGVGVPATSPLGGRFNCQVLPGAVPSSFRYRCVKHLQALKFSAVCLLPLSLQRFHRSSCLFSMAYRLFLLIQGVAPY